MSDINELFAREPLEHTEADIEKMIEYYRGARDTFHLDNPSAGRKTAKPKKKPVVDVDLTDLFN